jgi:hypothetical protein
MSSKTAKACGPRSQWLQTKTGARHRTHRNRRGGAVCVSDDSGCGRESQRVEYCPGIRAQHGVGARRRYETWQLRSAPCLSQSQQVVSNTVCPRHAETARATRDGLWICGQRKGVAHIPTGPTTTATSFNLMNSKNGQTARKVLSQHGYRGGQQTIAPSFTRILTTIHKPPWSENRQTTALSRFVFRHDKSPTSTTSEGAP